MTLHVGHLDPGKLATARALLSRALPHDRIDVVVTEKLFGDNGARVGHTLGAYEDDALVGVLAQAGRFIKILAVDPDARRRGVGTALLDAASELAAEAARRSPSPSAGVSPSPSLRICDHPGNYLSPGVDARYADGLAFLGKRGFVERGRVENLRVPYAGNALVSAARADALRADAAKLGYRIARPDGGELARTLDMIATEFAPVWASEARLAATGPRQALFAAFAGDDPVAFAAADGNNTGLGWFGPAGTLPDRRGKRLGEALLLACLVAVEGLPEAGVIAWIGPRPFYERAAAAVSDRIFVQLERGA